MAQITGTNSWDLRRVTFRVSREDLFQVPADAIVNSEQTDFVLSKDPETISGQLWSEFGSTLQAELDAQTGGATLPRGTVLKTSGGKRYRAVFHAGFHTPNQWLDEDIREDVETESISEIRRCVRRVLDDLEPLGIESVAFPMIGTGHFGLNARLLAYQFAREVAAYASSPSAPKAVIWLTVYNGPFEELVSAAIQGMLDELAAQTSPLSWDLGVGFLDRFNQRQLAVSHASYRAWMTTRYAELVINYFLFNLAVDSIPIVTPDKIVSPAQSLSFGLVRKEAQVLAIKYQRQASGNPWTTYMAERLRRDKDVGHRITRIVEDRNNIAHGRASRDADHIEADLEAFIGLERWSQMRSKHGEPREHNLTPWVRPLQPRPGHTGAMIIGVLDRVTREFFDYVVPESGEFFRCARS